MLYMLSMVPVRLLLDRASILIPIEKRGKLPVKSLFGAARTVKFAKLDTEDGIEPEKWLSETISVCKFVKEATVSSVPFKLLPTTVKNDN